jgi:signal transduction histidine kinase/DNA-binding NarL/FixJ family response regulator
MLRCWEQRDLEKRAGNLTQEQVEKLQGEMLRSMEVLHSVAALCSARGQIQREEFHRFVESALVRQPELQALSWNPVVSDAERDAVEAAAVAGGVGSFEFRELSAGGKLVRAGTRPQYVPVLFIEPSRGNDVALGYDLNSDTYRRVALEQARASGEAVATEPVRLAQGPGSQSGFLVLHPVYLAAASPAAGPVRQRNLTGFAVAVFRMTDLVAGVCEKLRQQGIEVAIFDQSRPTQAVFTNLRDSNTPPRSASGGTIWLEVANRRWAVHYVPQRTFIAGQSHSHSWLVLAGGLAFSGLTTAYLVLGWRQTRRIAEANAALQEEVAVRQRAEAAAEAANRAKSDFLASMSHEIRTPLNAILGYAQLLQRDRAISPEHKDGLACIGTSGQHLLSLLNEILDLSKIEAGRMDLIATDFDLGALGRSLASTFRPLCAEKCIGFRQVLEDPQRAWVHGDEGKLRQVLINLLGNAFKFTQAGEVFLHFKLETEDRWLFEVIDTGQGIPEEEQTKIFEPFHQGSNAQHQGGTGLGLAIAQKQVGLLGGMLQMQSERGIGSRFYFQIHLPAAPPATRPQTVPRTVERLRPGCRVRVLVVDDRKENQNILRSMLESVGCEVALANNGLEALKVAQQTKPHIAFVDVLMPELDGIAAAREMLADPCCGSPKIVAHSASALPRYREDARRAGCVDFLPKPISADQLYECLRAHLGAEFECAPPAHELEALPAWAGEPIQLPQDLYARLATAAELHSTTTLKSCLQDLRQTGPQAQQLCEHIRHLMRSYDMEGISRLIERAAVPGSGVFQPNPTYGPATIEQSTT